MVLKRTKSNNFLVVTLLSIFYSFNANAFELITASKQNQKDFSLDGFNLHSIISSSSDQRSLNYKHEKYSVSLLNQKVDKKGKQHTRYVQTYNNIPIYGRQIVHHKDKNRNGFGFFANNSDNSNFTGQLISGLANDLVTLKPLDGFTKEEALNFAKLANYKKLNLNISPTDLYYENEKSELVIYTHSKDNSAKLAYKVSFFVDDKDGNHPMRPNFIIDATNKKIIKSWNALMHSRVATGPGGNEKIGRYGYGEDLPKLDVRETRRGECFMTSSKVRTVDLKNGYYGAKTHHFNCYENSGDEVNGAYSPLNDAHYYGEQVFNMYREWYDKAPLTFKLIMRVHYGRNYENAFWNGSSMTFGDGRNYFYPLVSMDVVAHEVSHGYTEQNSNLEYMGQSGGLNESFSDMAGKAGEYYTFGKNTWGIGDDVTKGDEPLRYMDTPEKDGISIGDARDYNDWLDVHYSSGVFNRAFYLLSTYQNWSLKQAFDVFVHANTYYWIPTSDYIDAATGSVYSAEDLGYDVNDVIDVFKQVGIACNGDSCEIMPDDRDTDDGDTDDNSSEDSDENNEKEMDLDLTQINRTEQVTS